MPDLSDEEGDSRTASVGQTRSHSNNSLAISEKKKSRKSKRSGQKEEQDIVLQGAKFSTTPLEVDPEDSTSSSGSDSLDSVNVSEQNAKKRRKTNAPAINWNQASRSAIRTTLGAKPAATAVRSQQTKSAFDAVNDKFFRSRSASVSEEEMPSKNGSGSIQPSPKVDQERKTYFVDDSDASDSGEVSEGDDSMMLNIGKNSNTHGGDGAQDDANDLSTPRFVVDTLPSTQLDQPNTQETGSVVSEVSYMQLPPQSKAEAFAEFATIYTTSPSILADLKVKDLEIQARFFFYNSNIQELDLTKPISCTECLQEGHLSPVCPTKEVSHISQSILMTWVANSA